MSAEKLSSWAQVLTLFMVLNNLSERKSSVDLNG